MGSSTFLGPKDGQLVGPEDPEREVQLGRFHGAAGWALFKDLQFLKAFQHFLRHPFLHIRSRFAIGIPAISVSSTCCSSGVGSSGALWSGQSLRSLPAGGLEARNEVRRA